MAFKKALIMPEVWKCLGLNFVYGCGIFLLAGIMPVMYAIHKYGTEDRSSRTILVTFDGGFIGLVTMMMLNFVGTTMVDNKMFTGYWKLFVDKYLKRSLIFVAINFYALRSITDNWHDARKESANKTLLVVCCVSQMSYALIFATIEVKTVYSAKIFHLFCHHYKIRLPTNLFIYGQVAIFGVFIGFYSTLAILFSALILQVTPLYVDNGEDALYLRVLSWMGLIILKVSYEVLLLKYFCGKHMLYVNVAVSEVMYFYANFLSSSSLRIIFARDNVRGAALGGSMVLLVEVLIFIQMIRRSLEQLRDDRSDRNVAGMNREMILKVSHMQASTALSVSTPLIGMVMLFLCKFSETHSDFVHNIGFIEDDDIHYSDINQILIVQVVPSLAFDVIKLAVLRSKGFDLMAYWKTQTSPRLQIGKAVGAVFSVGVIMVLLLNQFDLSDYIIYDAVAMASS